MNPEDLDLGPDGHLRRLDSLEPRLQRDAVVSLDAYREYVLDDVPVATVMTPQAISLARIAAIAADDQDALVGLRALHESGVQETLRGLVGVW